MVITEVHSGAIGTVTCISTGVNLMVAPPETVRAVVIAEARLLYWLTRTGVAAVL